MEIVYLFGGISIGWFIQWMIDRFYWRNRRICSAVEQELHESTEQLTAENSVLRTQVEDYASRENRLTELESLLRTKSERLRQLEQRLPPPGESSSGKSGPIQTADTGLQIDLIVASLTERLSNSNATTVNQLQQVVDQRHNRLEATLEKIRTELASHDKQNGASLAYGSGSGVGNEAARALAELEREKERRRFGLIFGAIIGFVIGVILGYLLDAEIGGLIGAGVGTGIGAAAANRFMPKVNLDLNMGLGGKSGDVSQPGIGTPASGGVSQPGTGRPAGGDVSQPGRDGGKDGNEAAEHGPVDETSKEVAEEPSVDDGVAEDVDEATTEDEAEPTEGEDTEDEPTEEETAEEEEAEETAVAQTSAAGNDLYHIKHQWGGADAPWRDGGSWVLGGRGGMRIVAFNFTSKDRGQTLSGTCTYIGEEPLHFRATMTAHNTYEVELKKDEADASWQDGGMWLIGARANHHLIALNLSSADEGITLIGTCTYDQEGEINCRCEEADGGIYTMRAGGDYPDGCWVLGARADMALKSLKCISDDGGRTLMGTCSYDGETIYQFRAARWACNSYRTEYLRDAEAGWESTGIWVLGSRTNLNVVSLDLEATPEGELAGLCAYAGEATHPVICKFPGVAAIKGTPKKVAKEPGAENESAPSADKSAVSPAEAKTEAESDTPPDKAGAADKVNNLMSDIGLSQPEDGS